MKHAVHAYRPLEAFDSALLTGVLGQHVLAPRPPTVPEEILVALLGPKPSMHQRFEAVF
jgi:hypothetical protein